MLKVYICSSLRDDNYLHVTRLLKELPPAVHLRPAKGEDTLEGRRNHVEIDIAMLQYCDEIWVLGAYGRDCSWEIGYAMGIKKSVRILVDDTNAHTIENDWMLQHGKQIGLLHAHSTIHGFKTAVLGTGRVFA